MREAHPADTLEAALGRALRHLKNLPSQSIPLTEKGSVAMRVANLLVADPLTGGRTIASHLLASRVTDLIRNAGLR